MDLTGLFIFLKRTKPQKDLFIGYSCLIQWDIDFSLFHKDSYTLHLNDLSIALITTKEDLPLVQQAQVHKNIGTNFRHQSLICMAHKIHLNPGNLSTSDFFSVKLLSYPELCWSIPRDASAQAGQTPPNLVHLLNAFGIGKPDLWALVCG